MRLKKGQVWREVDKRFDRYIEIVGFDQRSQRVMIKNMETGRFATARVNRFNGKSHGYEFICNDKSLFPCKHV